ncbi:hypothetical protein SPURM210S_06818 [Streptomyces purpurascens]
MVGVARALLVAGERGADVGLEVGLPEALTGPAGEHPGAVGVQAEERGDLAGRLVLDLGVPQHGLPPLGQRPEGLHGHGPLGLVHRPHVRAQFERVAVGHVGPVRGLGGEDREVVDELFPPRRPRPGGGDAPHGGEQVRADGVLGAGAAAHRLEHAGEDLGGQVVRGVRVTAAGPGVPAHALRMAPVQLLVRRVVARTHPVDELGVGRREVGGWRQDAVLAPVALCRDRPVGGVPARRDARASALARHLFVPPVNAHAESPRQPPNPSRPPGQSATGALGRDPRVRTITHPWGFTARQY